MRKRVKERDDKSVKVQEKGKRTKENRKSSKKLND